MYYIIFDCGCKIEHNKCYRVHDKGVRMCPLHRDAKIICAIFKCHDCGKELLVQELKNTVKKFCAECAKHQPTQYERNRKKKLKATLIAPPVPKPDCKHYLTKCLPDICKDPAAVAVRCNL